MDIEVNVMVCFFKWFRSDVALNRIIMALLSFLFVVVPYLLGWSFRTKFWLYLLIVSVVFGLCVVCRLSLKEPFKNERWVVLDFKLFGMWMIGYLVGWIMIQYILTIVLYVTDLNLLEMKQTEPVVPLATIIWGCVTIGMMTYLEELAFRLYWIESIMPRYPKLAYVSSWFMFVLAHILRPDINWGRDVSVVSVVYYSYASAILVLSYKQTRSFHFTWALHAFFNALAFLN